MRYCIPERQANNSIKILRSDRQSNQRGRLNAAKKCDLCGIVYGLFSWFINSIFFSSTLLLFAFAVVVVVTFCRRKSHTRIQEIDFNYRANVWISAGGNIAIVLIIILYVICVCVIVQCTVHTCGIDRWPSTTILILPFFFF